MTTNMQGSHEATLKQSAIRKKIVGKGRLFSWREEERNEKKDVWQTICQDGAEFAESCRAWVQNYCCTINEGGVRE